MKEKIMRSLSKSLLFRETGNQGSEPSQNE